MTASKSVPEWSVPEFSRVVPLSEIGRDVVHHALQADENQRSALARRFGLISLDHLSAEVDLSQEDVGILLTGELSAQLVQACAATGEPVPSAIEERFAIRFEPEAEFEPNAEIDLAAEDCDIMFHDGRVIDLGEAVAQTLALSIEPFPRSASADEFLKKAGVKKEGEAGPFAILAALKKAPD